VYGTHPLPRCCDPVPPYFPQIYANAKIIIDVALRALQWLTVVLVEDSVDDGVEAARHVDKQLSGGVDVDECCSVGRRWLRAVCRVPFVRRQRHNLDYVVRKLTPNEHADHDDDQLCHSDWTERRQTAAGAGSATAFKTAARTTGRPSTKSVHQNGVCADDDGEWEGKSERQLGVGPRTTGLRRQLPDQRTPTTAVGDRDGGVDGVRQRGEERDEPNADADADTDANSSQTDRTVIAGQTAVDAERDERQYPGVLVGLAEHIRHLADDLAEHPVRRVRRHAVQWQRPQEKFVRRRQVEEVVVANRLGSYLRISTAESSVFVVIIHTIRGILGWGRFPGLPR